MHRQNISTVRKLTSASANATTSMQVLLPVINTNQETKAIYMFLFRVEQKQVFCLWIHCYFVHNIMKFLTVLVALCSSSNVAMSASPFVGDWSLKETFGEDMNPVTFPDDSTYKFHIEEEEDEHHLRLNIKIGNNLGGLITVEEAEDNPSSAKTVQISRIRSTRMRPPESLFKLETYLTNTLPKMVSMSVEGETLVFEGEGKIVCQLESHSS